MSEKLALEGLKIIDLTTAYSGPIGTLQFADYGAEVIKVEPVKGELARYWTPKVNDANVFYPSVNRNKKGISLNLRSEKGKQILFELVKDADALVENYRGGTLEKMGLGYDVLKQYNPKIIVASISGFGETGPMRRMAAYAGLAEAMSGLMSMTGDPKGLPYVSGYSLGDSVCGLFTMLGIMFALYHRDRTGEGQYIDVAMVDSLIAVCEGNVGTVDLTGEDVRRIGNRTPAGYPYDVFEASDGHCFLTVADSQDWSRFAKVCELEYLMDDPRFLTNELRYEHADELAEYINGWTRQHTRAEIAELFEAAGEGCAPILTVKEVMENEQVLHREMVIDVPDPVFGTMKQQGFPIKMSATPAKLRKGAPSIGEDNEEVYGALGYSADAIAQLKEEGVI